MRGGGGGDRPCRRPHAPRAAKYRASRRGARGQVIGEFFGVTWGAFASGFVTGGQRRDDDEARESNRLFMDMTGAGAQTGRADDGRFTCRIFRGHMIFGHHSIGLATVAAGQSNRDGLRALLVGGAALRDGRCLVNQDRPHG